MMKMNILKNGFQALIIVSLMAACSLGEVLEPSDGVNMALMETVDTVVAIPGDTISFKFIASTNGATLRRIEIVEKSHNFNELKDSIRFALVDETLELTVDEEGYLSRPVSTVKKDSLSRPVEGTVPETTESPAAKNSGMLHAQSPI